MVTKFKNEKIKIGIFGFTGCAGDQLVIIHDEDRLLEYFSYADIRSFAMASSELDEQGEIEVAFVEGSINTEMEIQELKEIRQRSKLLVAIGNCAISGGIQAYNFGDGKWKDRYLSVYGDTGMHTKAFEPTPLSMHVKVDAQIPGCPIDKDQIYNAFARLVHGYSIDSLTVSVCDICRKNENICLYEKGELCLGPVTVSGCNAACPSNNVVCMGCYGMTEEANISGFIISAIEKGFSKLEVIRRMKVHGGVVIAEELHKISSTLEDL